MNAKSRVTKEYELKEISESFAWIIKDKLTSLDNITRAMVKEMQVMGVPRSMIDAYLPQYFIELKEQVVREQSERYDRKKKVTA